MTITYTAYDDDRLQKIQEESYKLLQPGIYSFKVIEASEGVSKTSGNPMLTLSLGIWDEAGEAYTVKDYLVVTDKMIYKFKHFWASVGQPEMYGQPIEAWQLEGLEGKLKTRLEEQEVERKDGLGKQKMKFIRVEDYVKSNIKSRSLESVDDLAEDDIPF